MWRWVESIVVQAPVRLGLAGIFGAAAALKIADPQAFAFSIKAMQLVDAKDGEHLVAALAFGIPWAEMLVAVCLVLGLWTRAAAGLLSLMLVGFTGGLVSLIVRKIDTDCACFGDRDLFCEGGVGWCHVARNGVLLAGSAYLAWRGGGLLAVDRACERGCRAEASLDAGAEAT